MVPGNLRAMETSTETQNPNKQNLLGFWVVRYQPGGNKASIVVGRMNPGKIFGLMPVRS